MKYIVNIKVPLSCSEEELQQVVETTQEHQERLIDDYYFVVTRGVSISIYPKFLYNIKFILKRIRDWDYSKLWKWLLIN